MPDRICPPHVQKLFQNYDSALRIEWSVDRWACKRKLRDGRYHTIGYCRHDLLGDGRMWLDKMARNDLWKQYDGSGNKAADASDAEEQKATEQRKSQRLQNFIDLSKDEFVTIQRRCGERVNNAGMPEGSP